MSARRARDFAFADLTSGERWTVRPNDGPVPWWIFDASRRVPGTRAMDYLALCELLRARPARPIGEVDATARDPLYDRLLQPLMLAALNTDPPEAPPALAARILRETLARGGKPAGR